MTFLSKLGARPLKRFAQNEEGSMGVFGIYIFSIMAVIGGIALDVTQLYASRTQLQAAADEAAHAALYNRNVWNDDMTVEGSRTAALNVVAPLIPPALYGNALKADNIVFGTYDNDTQVFTPDVNSTTAVQVETSFLEADANAAKSYLFKLIGFDKFDIITTSIFQTYRPACLREGFVAQGIVDLQSNNGFSNGFCIHSNTHVSLNLNNFFEPGTVVSMPDMADLDLPNSGFESNEGLQTALRSAKMNIRIVSRIDDIIFGLQNGDAKVIPDYIISNTVIAMSGRDTSTADYTVGRIHYVTCTGPRLTIDAGTVPLSEVVIISPCEIKLSNNSALEDAIVASTKTVSDSINTSASLRLGLDDGCAAGGGAQLLTYGGVYIAADLEMYGGQIMAIGDINFTANANGVEGASMISGGEISGTSNMDMGFCSTGMEDNFEIDYFRMAG